MSEEKGQPEQHQHLLTHQDKDKTTENSDGAATSAGPAGTSAEEADKDRPRVPPISTTFVTYQPPHGSPIINPRQIIFLANHPTNGDLHSPTSPTVEHRPRSPTFSLRSGANSPYRRRSPSPSPTRNHVGTETLFPPSITYEVATAPTSPTSPTEMMVMQDLRGVLTSSQSITLHNKAVMVTPSGSLLAVNQPLELRESTLTVNYPDMGDDGEEVSLMYTRHEKIPMKDFSAEIRASLDVENFLAQARLMLDLNENNLETIMDRMLHSLLDTEEPQTSADDAIKALFTHDSVHQLCKTIQSTCSTYGGGFDYDQSWLCILCTLPTLQKRYVAIARLRCPANLGRTSQEVYFIILVVAPTKEKGTKNALETGRTFATLFADMDLRLRLLGARSEEEFKKLLWEHTKELADEQGQSPDHKSPSGSEKTNFENARTEKSRCFLARGLRSDFKRRLRFYLSDYKDGIIGPRTLQKTISTSLFLYFACILPSIALGVLNDTNTKGKIDVKKVIYAQSMGGLFFSLLGGQPMVIVLTTAPLALYTKVIYNISEDLELDFLSMYACSGLWNSFFLLIYAVTDAARLMNWSTRSTEEIFALFISIAFTVDAFTNVYHEFQKNYQSDSCDDASSPLPSIYNVSETSTMLPTAVTLSVTADNTSHVAELISQCLRESSLLYLLLMFGTVWLGLSLFNFTKTPFLNASKRELLADYALPTSVLLMSFFGSYVFRAVELEPFHYDDGPVFKSPPLQDLPWSAVFLCMGLGFCLSLLFFMDQNITGAMVNSPDNKLKKGPAYHWDILIVAVLNSFLTFFGLPMVHGALPHSPLHVRAMADVEDRVDQGHVYQKIMYVRETRVTGIVSHIIIGLSILLLPYPLSYIPRPVLDGLFLYLAITALLNNQMFERITLMVTEQSAYPPNHYIRSVPQRKVHTFTFLQILQLAVMCVFGFSAIAYLKMVFPVIILLLLPTRHKLVPLIVDRKYLEALDGH